jgi:putative ABC transport system substrate-binding protein
LVPTAEKVGLLMSPQFTTSEQNAAAAAAAAHAVGMAVTVERMMAESEFDGAFNRFAQERVSAILIFTNLFFASYRDRLTDLALRHGIPMFGQSRSWPVAGAVASYGTNIPDVIRQAGTYVGRILKGEKPADLPVLQPTKFELVINLKTAKALGLTVPLTLLARADEVIE